MNEALFRVPAPQNEPVLSYAPGTRERGEIEAQIRKFRSGKMEIPLLVGGEEIRTGVKAPCVEPHNHQSVLAEYHQADEKIVEKAIQASLRAKKDWERLSWHDRAAVFLKAAELLATKYRPILNAATMLGQSKSVHQAEIDSACELIDFFRFNAMYMQQIYADQPISSAGVWNRMEYRPLEGFVFALTPFNFTSIAGNLPGAPALLGNTVVWKPAETQIYSAAVIMEVFEAAGLPAGVINLVYVDGPMAGDVIFSHPDFAGLHFTGSTGVFQHLWQTIGKNIAKYKSYPRVVGETGGKDFVIAHPSADAKAVATALSRGAFEFQGQKCSAASRAYIPSGIWDAVKKYLLEDIASFTMGSPEDFSNFVNAVIDERAFDKITGYIAQAKKDADAEILIGGGYDKSEGYF
ncbi:MAG: aldehyde dehydrogenase family protein, partial [Bdellovibrionales bacterium]|nr:aldehyde dehydrogenase family protein [Bdellovibrionales bacterium]